MGFNYGYEKKKFDSRWKRLEVEYCDAGMSEVELSIFVQCLNPQNYAASANGCSRCLL